MLKNENKEAPLPRKSPTISKRGVKTDPDIAMQFDESFNDLTANALMDVHQHAALPFPRSLREFQRQFPDEFSG